MKENQDYKNEGLAALRGNWPQSVLATLIFFLIECALIGPYFGKALSLSSAPTSLATGGLSNFFYFFVLGAVFILGPLLIGLVNSFKGLLVSGDGEIASNQFRIGFKNYIHHVWGYFLRDVFIFLWSLLLIVPGIIKSFSYAMTNYILVDYPELSANKAIELSMEMMKGRKFDLFYLYLSFVGWWLLCILTLGIGYLWFYPYAQSAQASFYIDVKADYMRRKNSAEAPVAAPVVPVAPLAPTPASSSTEAQPVVSVQDAPSAQNEPSQDAPDPDASVQGRNPENPEDYMPKSDDQG